MGGAARRELGGKECARSARRRARPAYPSSRIAGNAHGIGEHELFYPWHPWAGCLVHIHEVVEKAGREIFRCSLSGRATGRWLEIPAWMFDRAARAAWRVGAAPYVDIAVLTALSLAARTASVAWFRPLKSAAEISDRWSRKRRQRSRNRSSCPPAPGSPGAASSRISRSLASG